MALVEVKNLKKTYSNGVMEVHAVNDVSFSIEKGEFIVLAGPSGSGKTTTLNLIGAMDSISSGSVSIENLSLATLTKDEKADFRRDKIGFIFQNFNLIPVLSVFENLEFILELSKKYNKAERGIKIESLLKKLDIWSLKDRRPGELSGGQQQRVAIARALVKDPVLVLADEPTANLDSHTGESVLNLMKKLNVEDNITFIFSSHDNLIIERAKRVIRLRDGKLVGDSDAT
ncbi:MAG: ABC transporter ATP-binding protein [Psychrilyobacter sp.]|nr:ABC transporter ATP-binding protein [Psychrilyobacter sp.]